MDIPDADSGEDGGRKVGDLSPEEQEAWARDMVRAMREMDKLSDAEIEDRVFRMASTAPARALDLIQRRRYIKNHGHQPPSEKLIAALGADAAEAVAFEIQRVAHYEAEMAVIAGMFQLLAKHGNYSEAIVAFMRREPAFTDEEIGDG